MIKFSTENRYHSLIVESRIFIQDTMAVSQEIERFSSYGFVTIGNKMNTYHGVAKETTLLSRKGILIDTCGGNFVGK